MKELSDGTKVSPMCYRYLVYWNEAGFHRWLLLKFNKYRIDELDRNEFYLTFNAATNSVLFTSL